MSKISYRELLRDDLDIDEAKKIQEKYQNLLVDRASSSIILNKKDIKVVVGVDVHYFIKRQKDWGVACAVFWDINKKRIIEAAFSEMEIKFPYKAGFLGFREAKIIVHAIRKSNLKADLLMCDGHGIIHPRRFGEAVHLGLILNIPSMGIAKNFFIGFSNWRALKRTKGEKAPIWVRDPNLFSLNNEILGYAICLADSKKPVFTSVGYNISIEDAIKIALETTIQHKQPEPLFLADKFARQFREE